MTLTGIEFGTPGTPGSTTGTPVPVPSVVGALRPAAEKTLKGFGFKPVVTEVEAGGVEDEVYAQDPMPPTTRPRGAVVQIFVITNPVPQPDMTERFDKLDEALKGVTESIAKLETTEQATGREQVLKDKLQQISDAIGQASPKQVTASRSKTTP
jgi:beta-lactam-binding protein with PASTA domain